MNQLEQIVNDAEAEENCFCFYHRAKAMDIARAALGMEEAYDALLLADGGYNGLIAIGQLITRARAQ